MPWRQLAAVYCHHLIGEEKRGDLRLASLYWRENMFHGHIYCPVTLWFRQVHGGKVWFPISFSWHLRVLQFHLENSNSDHNQTEAIFCFSRVNRSVVSSLLSGAARSVYSVKVKLDVNNQKEENSRVSLKALLHSWTGPRTEPVQRPNIDWAPYRTHLTSLLCFYQPQELRALRPTNL